MDGRPTWTDCDEAGDYVVPNVLSPRDLVFRPDNMDETVPHIKAETTKDGRNDSDRNDPTETTLGRNNPDTVSSSGIYSIL